MIIEIPDENSIIKWKFKDNENWNSAELSDLIKAYERPQGDLISREALKENIQRYMSSNWVMPCNEILKRIDNAPTIYTRPQGVWQETNELWETNCGGGMGYDYGYYFKCSACGKKGIDKTNFCPNCGADMRGKEE